MALEATCEVRSTGVPTQEFPHLIAMTCGSPAVAEVDIMLPACPQQPNPPLVFRVRLCEHHVCAYTGWH